MLSVIFQFLDAILSWLGSVLPASPFADLQLSPVFQNALGWLNWVFPVGRALQAFGLYLAALAAVVGIRALLRFNPLQGAVSKFLGRWF